MFARRATFLLTIPTSAPDLPSHGEAPQVDHVALHTFATKHNDLHAGENEIHPHHRETVMRLASEIETASNPHYRVKLYKYAIQALSEESCKLPSLHITHIMHNWKSHEQAWVARFLAMEVGLGQTCM